MKFNFTTSYFISLMCAIGLFACLKCPQQYNDTVYDASQFFIVQTQTPLNTPMDASSNAEDDSPVMNLPVHILPALPLAKTEDLSYWDTDDTGIRLFSRLYRPPQF